MFQLTNELSAVSFVVFHVFVQRQKARNVHRGKPRMYGIWESFHAILVALITQSLLLSYFSLRCFFTLKKYNSPISKRSHHSRSTQYTHPIYKWELSFLHVPKIDSEILCGKRRLLIKDWLFFSPIFLGISRHDI